MKIKYFSPFTPLFIILLFYFPLFSRIILYPLFRGDYFPLIFPPFSLREEGGGYYLPFIWPFSGLEFVQCLPFSYFKNVICQIYLD